MVKQGSKGGKRKARSEEGDEAAGSSKASAQSRKAVKRAQGHTPSRRGPAPGLRGQSPAQKGPGPSPLRHPNVGRGGQGPSRLAHSTHISDIENAAKAANSAYQVGLLYCQAWSETAYCMSKAFRCAQAPFRYAWLCCNHTYTLSRLGILFCPVIVMSVAASCRVSLRFWRGSLPLPFM